MIGKSRFIRIFALCRLYETCRVAQTLRVKKETLSSFRDSDKTAKLYLKHPENRRATVCTFISRCGLFAILLGVWVLGGTYRVTEARSFRAFFGT